MMQKVKKELNKFIFSKLNFQISDSLLISIILHIFLLIVMLVSPYIYTTSKIKKIKTNDPIIIDLENFKIDSKTLLNSSFKQNKKNTEIKQENKNEKNKVREKKYFKSDVQQNPKNNIKKEKQNIKNQEIKKQDADYIDNSKMIKKVEKVKTVAQPSNDLLSSRMGGLEDLLASVDGLKRTKQNLEKKKIKEIKRGISTTEIDSNINKNYPITNTNLVRRQMAISYIDSVKIKLASCWNLDPGAKGIKNMQIKIRASFLPDGSISNINILNYSEYQSSPWFQAVADNARRALLVCSPYNLPSEFYKDWKNIVFTFYPDKRSIR